MDGADPLRTPGDIRALRHLECSLARDGMIWIPGGTFRMGSDKDYPEEARMRRRHVVSRKSARRAGSGEL